MACLYCGKRLGLLKQFTDGDFCSRSHRKLYHERLRRAIGRLPEPEFVPAAAPAEAPAAASVATPARVATAPQPKPARRPAPETILAPLTGTRAATPAAVERSRPSEPAVAVAAAPSALHAPRPGNAEPPAAGWILPSMIAAAQPAPGRAYKRAELAPPALGPNHLARGAASLPAPRQARLETAEPCPGRPAPAALPVKLRSHGPPLSFVQAGEAPGLKLPAAPQRVGKEGSHAPRLRQTAQTISLPLPEVAAPNRKTADGAATPVFKTRPAGVMPGLPGPEKQPAPQPAEIETGVGLAALSLSATAWGRPLVRDFPVPPEPELEALPVEAAPRRPPLPRPLGAAMRRCPSPLAFGLEPLQPAAHPTAAPYLVPGAEPVGAARSEAVPDRREPRSRALALGAPLTAVVPAVRPSSRVRAHLELAMAQFEIVRPELDVAPLSEKVARPEPARDRQPWPGAVNRWVTARARLVAAACVLVMLVSVAITASVRTDRQVAWAWNLARTTIAQRSAYELTDNFEGGLKDWVGPGGWAASWPRGSDGWMRTGRLAIYTPSLELTDYSFEFLAKIENRAIAWAFRARDLDNYYAAKLRVATPGLRPLMELARYPVLGGRKGEQRQSRIPVMLHNDQPVRIRIEAKGDLFTVWVDGHEVDSWENSSLKTGGVGFFSEGSEAASYYWMKITVHDDALGRFCAYLAPHHLAELPRDPATAAGESLVRLPAALKP